MKKIIFDRDCKHLFNLVAPSPWPILLAFSMLILFSGIGFSLHKTNFNQIILIYGFFCVLLCSFFWLQDIVDESTFIGSHTEVVRMGLKKGFLLFIFSEIMLFSGFFWAFFHSSFSPSVVFDLMYPPLGINIIPTTGFPFFNTLLLLTSGIIVTWAHKGLALSSYKESIDSLLITILMGFFFVFLQGLEYYEASYNIFDSIYSSVFYMLTGLHGLHVLVGAIFLSVCLVRLVKGHFKTNRYLGFIFAVWYWHFVDIVWILLFLIIYCWGNW